MIALQSQAQPRLYFGYRSNLRKEQMKLRCPKCRLVNFRWNINDAIFLHQAPNRPPSGKRKVPDLGYANVVVSRNSEDEVYDLTSSNEDGLDHNEGDPYAYTKETIIIELGELKDGKAVDVSCQGMQKDVLVYIDRKRVVNDNPQEEYIHRMKKGIKDAVDRAVVPLAYMQKVMRPSIAGQGKKKAEGLARKQAVSFEDRK